MKKSINKTIYTYFEEKTMPPYVNLCLKTWENNIPKDYKIEKINRKNLFKYIPEKFLPDSLYAKCRVEKECSFPYFYDLVAAYVLWLHGGIFLDADTIMTDKFEPQEALLEATDLVVFSDGINNVCPGFMAANKNSEVLEELIRRYKFAAFLPVNPKTPRNFIFNDTIADFSSNDVILLDCEDYGYLMEKSMYGIFNEYLYKKYYFTDVCSTADFFENSKGLTALHNSMTPEKFKKTEEKEFLNLNILLSKIFKNILTAQTA